MLHAILRSVAVVHVQVHDRHAGEGGVGGARVRRADRHVVEEAEALTHVRVVRVVHRAARPDVVTRRAHAAEGVSVSLGVTFYSHSHFARRLRLRQRVHRRAHGLGGTARLRQRPLAHHRVNVQVHALRRLLRLSRARRTHGPRAGVRQLHHVVGVVHAQDVRERQQSALLHHLHTRLQRRLQQAACLLRRQQDVETLHLLRGQTLQLGVRTRGGGNGAWGRVGTGLMRIEWIGDEDEGLGFLVREVGAA